MSISLHRVLPAASGQAVDARLLNQHIVENSAVESLLVDWANAWYTRFDGTVEGREQALRLVGGQVGALLCLTVPLVEHLRGGLDDPAASLLFGDAVATATAARLLAEVNREVDPDLASLIALLRALGPALALMNDAEAQLRWWRDVRRAWGPQRAEASQALFGADPAVVVGTWALEQGASASLAAAIVDVDRDAAGPVFAKVLPIVEGAVSLVEALGAVDSGAALNAWVGAAPLSTNGAWSLVDEVLETAPSVATLLALPCVTRQDRHTLCRRGGSIHRVQEPAELELLALLQAQLIHALRAQATRMSIAMRERLRVDPVTELPTFQAFIEDLTKDLEDPDEAPQAMITFDLSEFGDRVADEGVQATDALLRQVSKALVRVVPDGRITRCGPATFVLAIPQGGRRARFTADRIHDVIDPIAGTPRISVIDVPRAIGGQSAERLVERARRSLYRSYTARRRRVG